MKKVFSNANDCIHAFAQRNQSEGRSSNVFFYGNKLYSYGYHYLLAEFLDDDNIFINDKGYSNTTAKHISSVRYGTRQYNQWFATSHDLSLVYNQVVDAKNKLANARKRELYIDKITSLWDSLNKFLEYRRTSKKLTKKNFQAYRDEKYIEIKKIVDSLNKDAHLYVEKIKAAKVKADIAQQKKDATRLKKALKSFNDYEIDSFRIGDEDYLRLSADRTMVETSQGVNVSINGAKLLYTAIKNGVDITGRHIDSYTVTSINGVLTIGCHRINMASVKQIGELIINTKK